MAAPAVAAGAPAAAPGPGAASLGANRWDASSCSLDQAPARLSAPKRVARMLRRARARTRTRMAATVGSLRAVPLRGSWSQPTPTRARRHVGNAVSGAVSSSPPGARRPTPNGTRGARLLRATAAQAALDRPGGERGARGEAQLAQDVAQVAVRGAL